MKMIHREEYTVSVSHGMLYLDALSDLTLDQAINQADLMMYEEKEKIHHEEGGILYEDVFIEP